MDINCENISLDELANEVNKAMWAEAWEWLQRYEENESDIQQKSNKVSL